MEPTTWHDIAGELRPADVEHLELAEAEGADPRNLLSWAMLAADDAAFQRRCNAQCPLPEGAAGWSDWVLPHGPVAVAWRTVPMTVREVAGLRVSLTRDQLVTGDLMPARVLLDAPEERVSLNLPKARELGSVLAELVELAGEFGEMDR